jgi:hypothetical protein
MASEMVDQPDAPRRRRVPVLGCLSLVVSLVALLVALASILYSYALMQSQFHELRAFRLAAGVPKMHNTVEERPSPEGQTRSYRVRLLNLDVRPVEQLRVVIEVFQDGIALPPPKRFATEPAYRVAVRGDDRRAVVRFDQDLPPGEEVDLLVKDVTVTRSAGYEWLRVFVYTKQGESKVSWVRLLPRRPGGAS